MDVLLRQGHFVFNTLYPLVNCGLIIVRSDRRFLFLIWFIILIDRLVSSPPGDPVFIQASNSHLSKVPFQLFQS